MPGVTVQSLMKVMPGVIFHRSQASPPDQRTFNFFELIDDQRIFDSRIFFYGEKARSKAWSSVAQASPPTKPRNLTFVDAFDEKSETKRERKTKWWVRDFGDCLN